MKNPVHLWREGPALGGPRWVAQCGRSVVAEAIGRYGERGTALTVLERIVRSGVKDADVLRHDRRVVGSIQGGRIELWGDLV